MDFGKLKAMGEKALGGTGATGGQTAPGGSGLDFNQLKSMGEKALGGSSSNTTAPAPTADASNPAPAAPAASGSAEGQDYGDKAFAFVSQKSGHKFDAAQSEKITDGARGAYEKATGKKLDSKWSN